MLEPLACLTDGNTQLRQSLPGHQAEPALISLPDTDSRQDSPHNPNPSLIQPSLNLQLLPTLHPHFEHHQTSSTLEVQCHVGLIPTNLLFTECFFFFFFLTGSDQDDCFHSRPCGFQLRSRRPLISALEAHYHARSLLVAPGHGSPPISWSAPL